jgi:ABC-type phosphate transport system substrate-binding protein
MGTLMKKLIIALLFLTSIFAIDTAFADPVAVVVNSANTQNLSQEEVKNIYTDKTIVWKNGGRIAVYNLPTEEAAAEVFASKVLGMSASIAAAAESNRVVSNVARNPQQIKRAELVSSIVAKTPNAIGYVPKAQAEGKSGIRVLFTLE